MMCSSLRWRVGGEERRDGVKINEHKNVVMSMHMILDLYTCRSHPSHIGVAMVCVCVCVCTS